MSCRRVQFRRQSTTYDGLSDILTLYRFSIDRILRIGAVPRRVSSYSRVGLMNG